MVYGIDVPHNETVARTGSLGCLGSFRLRLSSLRLTLRRRRNPGACREWLNGELRVVSPKITSGLVTMGSPGPFFSRTLFEHLLGASIVDMNSLRVSNDKTCFTVAGTCGYLFFLLNSGLKLGRS